MLVKKCPECKVELLESVTLENKKILECYSCKSKFTVATGNPYVHFTGKNRLKQQ